MQGEAGDVDPSGRAVLAGLLARIGHSRRVEQCGVPLRGAPTSEKAHGVG